MRRVVTMVRVVAWRWSDLSVRFFRHWVATSANLLVNANVNGTMEAALRINEIDGVAFERQERNARRADKGLPPVPELERDPWLQVQWNTFSAPASLAAEFPELCDAVGHAFAAAGQPMPATSVTFRGRDVRWSPKALAKVVEAWASGDLDRVTVDFSTPEMDRQAEISVLVAPGVGEATVFQVTVWTAPDVGAVAEQLLPVVSDQALLSDTVYGAITYDFGESFRLPFEMWYGVGGDGWQAAHLFTRGYYWANLLSHRHLLALGGLVEARRRTVEAGMLFVPLREEPGRELAWIRMPGRADEVSDEQLAAIKRLLSPTWAPVRHRYYTGYPLRVLKDPGDAYLLPPVGTKLPHFDSDNKADPDDPLTEPLEAWYREVKSRPELWTWRAE